VFVENVAIAGSSLGKSFNGSGQPQMYGAQPAINLISVDSICSASLLEEIDAPTEICFDANNRRSMELLFYFIRCKSCLDFFEDMDIKLKKISGFGNTSTKTLSVAEKEAFIAEWKKFFTLHSELMRRNYSIPKNARKEIMKDSSNVIWMKCFVIRKTINDTLKRIVRLNPSRIPSYLPARIMYVYPAAVSLYDHTGELYFAD
jgi:hypothetical protein